MRLHRRSGFTLIELLIVVAIIAILAAIAVPNFLEAQVRAKVSRAKAEHRTIATAIEAYTIDWNICIPDSDDALFDPANNEKGLLYLTSPVAYLTSLPADPFQAREAGGPHGRTNYEIGSGADNEGWRNRPDMGGAQLTPISNNLFRTPSWEVSSVGPDRLDDILGNDEWPGPSVPNTGIPSRILSYDPTNGTISAGDIARIGGVQCVGFYYVDDVLYGNSP